MSDLDDIVRRCQQNDKAALDELFRSQQARVYRLAVAILRDRQDAEDAVQEIFLRVFNRIRSFRGQSSFSTWLTAIAVNHCRDRLRQRNVRRLISLERLRGHVNKADVADTIADRQHRRTLWSLVNRLQEKLRLPVILHYQEGFSCEEIGLILELPTNTIYSRLFSARLQLRAMLKEDEAIEIMRDYVEHSP